MQLRAYLCIHALTIKCIRYILWHEWQPYGTILHRNPFPPIYITYWCILFRCDCIVYLKRKMFRGGSFAYCMYIRIPEENVRGVALKLAI